MYQQPRKGATGHRRITYMKQNKNTQIEWILNLLDSIPKYELEHSNMKELQENQLLKVLETEPFKVGKLFTYRSSEGKFIVKDFCLFQNMLVMLDESLPRQQQKVEQSYSNAEYLVLSGCTLEQKNIHYKEHEAIGFQLSNEAGNTFLFFDAYVAFLEWYKEIKKYAKLTNFTSKYSLKEKMSIPNYFVCVKNKNNRLFTVQIHKLSDLHRHLSSYEALMNEIGVYMCCQKKTFFLQYRQIYEDKMHLYVVYDYWEGEQLSKLITQLTFTQQQLNSIILQLIRAAKYLQNQGLYHGLITPNNILILKTATTIVPQSRQTQGIRCILFNFAYREQNNQDLYWLLKRTPISWISPEISHIHAEVRRKDKKQVKTLSRYADLTGIDAYQIGCILYVLSFISIFPKLPSYKVFMESINIDHTMIAEIVSQGSLSLQDYSKTLYSHSQLDLIIQLLSKSNVTRISLQQASKHQWFVNNASKLNATQLTKQLRVLPSLRTILEIREQSSYEMFSSRFGFDGPEIFDDKSSSNDEEGDEHDNLHKISRELSTLQLQVAQLPNNIQQASRKQKTQQFII